MKKIDIRAAIEWKIECSLYDHSMNMGDGLNFEEYVVEEGKNNLHLPTTELTSSLFMLSGLNQFDRPAKRVTVLAAALKSTREHQRHLYILRADELEKTSVEWLLKNDRVANILILNDVTGKVDQAHIRSLRDAKYKVILRVSTEALAGAQQYLPNTDWLVIEGKLKSTKANKRRLNNLVWECHKRDIPFWSTERIDLSQLLADWTSKVTITKQVRTDMPGYDFPDLGEYALWDSKQDTTVIAKTLEAEVMSARDALARSTMQLAYRLHQLHEMAIRSGKRAFYQINFNVGSLGEYCEQHLGVKANVGRQYLLAIRTVNALDPQLLSKTFDSDKEEVKNLPLGHTRFRDISKHLSKMLEVKSKDTESFDRLRANVFNPELSTRELMEVTETELGIKRPSKSTTTNVHDTPTDSLRNRLIQLRGDLKELVEPSKHDDIDALVMQLLTLLPITIEEQSEITAMDDFDLDWKTERVEKVSRETPSRVESITISSGDDTEGEKEITKYIERQVKEGIWKEVTLSPSITGLPRPIDIYTSERKDSFIKWTWHGDKDTFCPPIWADIALGSGACGFQCRTCFLMLTFRSMRDPSKPLVYTNYDQLDSDVAAWLNAKTFRFQDPESKKMVERRRTYKDTIGLGIDCSDSLLFEGYTNTLHRVAPLFQKESSNPLGAQLILLTKSANTQLLDDIDPKNIVVTMSLNPEGIADLWEGKYSDGVRVTPRISNRLEALKHAQDLGFEVRVRLDPILTPEGWEDQYREFAAQMAALKLTPSFITLGTYREKNHQLDTWREKWGLPAPELDQFDVSEDREGTHHHVLNRRAIYTTVKEIIHKEYPSAKMSPRISLCKETHHVRKETGMNNAYCNCLHSGLNMGVTHKPNGEEIVEVTSR